MFKRTGILTLWTVLLIAGIVSCDDNPVDNDSNHDHAEAEAMLVLHDTDTLLFQHEDDGILAEQSLTLTAGRTSEEIEVKFQAHDGGFFQPEEEHFSIETTIDDPGIALVITGTPRWSFTVEAIAPGSTTLSVKLMHGTHADFTGQDIPVQVTE